MTLKALVPLASVRSVAASIAFYAKLGFEVGNTHTPDGEAEPVWAWLRTGEAHLMLARAGDPVEAGKQSVLFYLYSSDVAAFRESLLAAGVEAGPIQRPFYAPGGEFRVTDPDGYVLMVTHT
jgi:catechol 2,3-dioxygenase-like lactoylglutathione lyase family enzyme